MIHDDDDDELSNINRRNIKDTFFSINVEKVVYNIVCSVLKYYSFNTWSHLHDRCITYCNICTSPKYGITSTSTSS